MHKKGSNNILLCLANVWCQSQQLLLVTFKAFAQLYRKEIHDCVHIVTYTCKYSDIDLYVDANNHIQYHGERTKGFLTQVLCNQGAKHRQKKMLSSMKTLTDSMATILMKFAPQ